jgi:hypothetical protein
VIICENRKKKLLGNSRQELYFLCVPRASLFLSNEELGTTTGTGTGTGTAAVDGPTGGGGGGSYLSALCSYKDFKESFSIFEPFFIQSMLRMNKTEKRRLDLQESLQQLLCHATASSLGASDRNLRNSLAKFLTDNSYLKKDFLLHNPPKKLISGGGGGLVVQQEGLACVRAGQTHWIEEYLILTERELTFQSLQSSSHRHHRGSAVDAILLSEILEVRLLEPGTTAATEWPFVMEDCYFLLVSTLPKEFLILIRGWEVIQEWYTVLLRLQQRAVTAAAGEIQLERFSDKLTGAGGAGGGVTGVGGDSFRYLMSQPLDWKLGDRAILNGRQFCGRLNLEYPSPTHSSGPSQGRHGPHRHCHLTSSLDCHSHDFPLKLLERSLDLILNLSTSFARGDDIAIAASPVLGAPGEWLEFLSNISLLSSIDLSRYQFSETELTSLFINLYHTMILHSFVIAGPPSTLLRWPSFFNSYAYEAFG